MQITEISSKEVWESFIAAAGPHTFLHSWNWGEVQKKCGHDILRLGVYNASTLAAVALIIKTKARRGSFLFCPHGPILAKETDARAVIQALSKYLKILGKKEGFKFIRISPLLLDSTENEQVFLDAGFRQAPVHMMHPELAWMLDLSVSEDELLKNMRKTTRYCIKKAEKEGIEVTASERAEDIDLFWPVYMETVQRQQFAPFSKETLRAEVETLAQDKQIQFFFARYHGSASSPQEGTIIAAAIIIFYGNSAFYHHGASSQRAGSLNTAYLLQWRAIQEAKRRGLAYYNFWGVVPENKTKHPWAGLSLFKRGFGGFSQAYVHAKDLILSPKYWISYMVEAARKKSRRL